MGLRATLRSLVYGPAPDAPALRALDLARKAGRAPTTRQAGAITPGGDAAYGGQSGGRWNSWSTLLPSTKIDYKTEAGDPALNSIVQACVQWIGRTFPEAPLQVLTKGKAGGTPIPDHPLTTLLAQPNPSYNGLLLWSATLGNLNISGNAYWLKVYNAASKLVELWWEPDYSCRPFWDTESPNFIDGYQVQRNGQWLIVPGGPDAIVHYRMGLDPRNPRLGLSPLAAALREIFTDNEAANFTAALVRNMGVPGVVISPMGDTTIADPKGLKQAMISSFGGDRRGDPMVMEGPTKIDVLSFSPAEMNLEKIRNIPEERICALIGIPPIIAGLGSGLDHSTFSNTKQAKEAAYHANILPTQALVAAQMDTSLLPDLGDPARQKVAFDTSQVAALSEDRDALYKRVNAVWLGGLITRGEGRTALNAGYASTEADNIYRSDLINRTERLTEAEIPGTLIADLGPEGEPTGKARTPASNGHTPPPQPATDPGKAAHHGTE